MTHLYTGAQTDFLVWIQLCKAKGFLPRSDCWLLPHPPQAEQLQQFTCSVFDNPFDFLCRELGQFTPTSPCTHGDFQQKAKISRYRQDHLLAEIKEDTHPQLEQETNQDTTQLPCSLAFAREMVQPAQAVKLHENLPSLNILMFRYIGDGGHATRESVSSSASTPPFVLNMKKPQSIFSMSQCTKPHLTWLFLRSLLFAPWSCRGLGGHQNLHHHPFLCRCASACSAQSHVTSVSEWLLKYGSVCV